MYDARSEERDITTAETQQISKTFLKLARKVHWAEQAENFRIAARYPDVMALLYEAIAYQETTLSLPDYSGTEFPVVDSAPMPHVRNF
jgi:hypothetical protein